uniref:Uncharacterized protein n=1 Tax=Panagrolaimus sp. JU765 TaxID=591449 RepID=A0AC34Q789_9BILA
MKRTVVLNVENRPVKLKLFERQPNEIIPRCVTPSFDSKKAAVLLFDMTRAATFDFSTGKIKPLERRYGPIPMALVANTSDNAEEVSRDDIKTLCEDKGITCHFISLAPVTGSFINLQTIEFPAQFDPFDSLMNPKTIFKQCGALLFVIDAQAEINDALKKMSHSIVRAYNINKNIRFEVCEDF